GPPPQFFWLWAPINFPHACTHFDTNDLADGRPWHRSGAIVPVLDTPDAAVLDPGDVAEPLREVGWEVEWQPGTRRAASAELPLEPWRGESEHISLEPLATFQMLGLGYLHPEWNH